MFFKLTNKAQGVFDGIDKLDVLFEWKDLDNNFPTQILSGDVKASCLMHLKGIISKGKKPLLPLM